MKLVLDRKPLQGYSFNIGSPEGSIFVLRFSYDMLKIFLMMSSVVLSYMLMMLVPTLIVIRLLS